MTEGRVASGRVRETKERGVRGEGTKRRRTEPPSDDGEGRERDGCRCKGRRTGSVCWSGSLLLNVKKKIREGKDQQQRPRGTTPTTVHHPGTKIKTIIIRYEGFIVGMWIIMECLVRALRILRLLSSSIIHTPTKRQRNGETPTPTHGGLPSLPLVFVVVFCGRGTDWALVKDRKERPR